jgi:hypothetical protein
MPFIIKFSLSAVYFNGDYIAYLAIKIVYQGIKINCGGHLSARKILSIEAISGMARVAISNVHQVLKLQYISRSLKKKPHYILDGLSLEVSMKYISGACDCVLLLLFH